MKPMKQLQASGNNGRSTMLQYSDRLEKDMEFIRSFCKSALNINPSVTTIVRRAIAVYVAHLAEKVVEAKQAQVAGARPEAYLTILSGVLRQERDAIKRAAGRDV